MALQHPSRLAAKAIALALVFTFVLSVSTVAAARDRTPPTTPKNLRVTGMTPYSVSLAWTPSTDNSGSFTYKICCANTSSESFPAPASSRIYRAGLEANRSFTLRISAVDAAGNYSGYSNAVSFTLPPDVTPPTKPVVSVTDVGPTHVSLAWSSTEDGPNVWFTVFMNGNPISQGAQNTSATFGPLEPETTYAFTVQARDFGGNVSPISDPVTVTTAPGNPNDTTPPTTPANLTDNGMSFGDGETWLFWEQSTDNVDPRSVIRYDIYANGVLDHSLMGAEVPFFTALPAFPIHSRSSPWIPPATNRLQRLSRLPVPEGPGQVKRQATACTVTADSKHQRGGLACNQVAALLWRNQLPFRLAF